MIRILRLGCVVVSALAVTFAQKPVPKLAIRVEILMDKIQYVEGEPITYKVMLINGSENSIYVPKYFGAASCSGFAFETKITQLTGKSSHMGCGCAADKFNLEEDKRSSDQILAEDFLEVRRGQIIGATGVEQRNATCNVPRYPGTYELSATFYPAHVRFARPNSIAPDAQILTEAIIAKPVRFRVVTKAKK